MERKVESPLFLRPDEHEAGGAIANMESGRLKMTDCELAGNKSFDLGGALFNEFDGTALINECTFIDNEVVGAADLAWGGAPCNRGSLVVTGSRFDSNGACDGGAHYGEGDFRYCVFVNNSVTFFGGAVDNLGGRPALCRMISAS